MGTTGLEPVTVRLEGGCSIQLSYVPIYYKVNTIIFHNCRNMQEEIKNILIFSNKVQVIGESRYTRKQNRYDIQIYCHVKEQFPMNMDTYPESYPSQVSNKCQILFPD
jgi:hypothetical protein